MEKQKYIMFSMQNFVNSVSCAHMTKAPPQWEKDRESTVREKI